MDADVYKAIQKWSGELDGVLTLPDLRVILGDKTEAAMYKRLNRLIEAAEAVARGEWFKLFPET